MQCVHGDVKRYPKVEVLVGVQEQMYLLNVALVTSLLADMIFGRDLYKKENCDTDVVNAMPVC